MSAPVHNGGSSGNMKTSTSFPSSSSRPSSYSSHSSPQSTILSTLRPIAPAFLFCQRLIALEVVDDPNRRVKEIRAWQPDIHKAIHANDRSCSNRGGSDSGSGSGSGSGASVRSSKVEEDNCRVTRFMHQWSSTGVLEAISAAVHLKPPVLCYPVSDIEAELPVCLYTIMYCRKITAHASHTYTGRLVIESCNECRL